MNKVSILNMIPYIVVLLSPFIACVIFFIYNGSSLFCYDAFNTAINDELGYYHNIRMIRDWWTPEGYTGYNEVLPALHGYGPYTVFTYMPYVALSFLTGINSHNFVMYCNLIMILLSLIILVRFSAINIPQSIAISVFLSTFLVMDYYIFSGMTEAAHVAFMVAVFGIMIRLYKQQDDLQPRKESAMIWSTTVLIIIFGIIRPYELTLLALPLIYVLKTKEKKSMCRYAIISSFLAVFVVLLYFYLTNNYCSPYFKQLGLGNQIIELIKHGQFFEIIGKIIQTNINSLNYLGLIKTANWTSAVLIIFLSFQVISLAITIIDIKKKKCNLLSVLGMIMLLISFLIYESNIILYSAWNLGRTLLSITVIMGLLLCIRMRACYRLIPVVPTISVMLAIMMIGTNLFILPQVSEQYQDVDDDVLREEFERIMPMSENSWDQTIAFEVQYSGMYIMFLLPSYLGLQCCEQSIITEKISDHSLQSKYVLTKSIGSVYTVCQNAGLTELWTDGTWCIWSIR
ncbi:MAG: hypothetical protein J5813_02980 [Candidatus Methanomethylophilaceae archaeon]|nr:hypothetical protein [Candidatus Methanomethylophilaceae archaeon]